MSNLIKNPMEHQGQRILTTKQLAECYGTDESNIKTNFNNNKSRFVEGKHYYQLEGAELKEFKGVVNNINDPSIKFASVLTLWTEKGCLRHAKILETDKAWEVYEQLEETYFRVKQQQLNLTQLSPELQAFHQIFTGLANIELQQKAQQQQLMEVSATANAIKETIIAPTDDWRKKINSMLNEIASINGNYQEVRQEAYERLESRAGCSLTRRLNNEKARLIGLGKSFTQVNKSSKIDIIEGDKRLKEIFTAIVKEMYIKHVA